MDKKMATTPSPHHYHVMDVTHPAAPAFVAEFRDHRAAKEYALDISQRGVPVRVDKGRYVK